MKPILFNTEMVRAILSGRKTVTRRVLKPQPPATSIVYKADRNFVWKWWDDSPDGHIIKPPYQFGDILWVRETWNGDWCDHYIYKADGGSAVSAGYASEPKWRPSIHMPRDAARIFLRVKEVRAERLNDIDNLSALDEGFDGRCSAPADGALSDWQQNYDLSVEKFASAWDRTIKSSNLAIYGWYANPWVWVIEFERVKKGG